jgi:hypothetical protein
MARPRAPMQPEPDPEPESKPAPEPQPKPEQPGLPPRLVAIGYVIALVCLVAPLAVLGAGFAGAVVFQRGRRGAGAGVIAVAVLCSALGFLLLR